MLLRYMALRGLPQTDAEWDEYARWKARQLAAPECRMTQVEAEGTCKGCRESPNCPKTQG